MTLGAKKNTLKDTPAHVQRTALKILGAMTFVGGVLLSGAGIWHWNQQRFIESSILTTAEVLEVHRSASHDDGRTNHAYSPTFRFTDEAGQKHTVTPWYSSSDWNFREGRTINIRYRPDSPQGAVPWGYADRLFGLAFPVTLLLIFGGILVLLGAVGSVSGYQTYRGAETRQRDSQNPSGPIR